MHGWFVARLQNALPATSSDLQRTKTTAYPDIAVEAEEFRVASTPNTLKVMSCYIADWIVKIWKDADERISSAARTGVREGSFPHAGDLFSLRAYILSLVGFVVSPAARDGDFLTILETSKLPVVLRTTSVPGRFTFVGCGWLVSDAASNAYLELTSIPSYGTCNRAKAVVEIE